MTDVTPAGPPPAVGTEPANAPPAGPEAGLTLGAAGEGPVDSAGRKLAVGDPVLYSYDAPHGHYDRVGRVHEVLDGGQAVIVEWLDLSGPMAAATLEEPGAAAPAGG